MCNFPEVAIPLESPGHLENPHICVLVNSRAEVPDDGQHQLPDMEVKMPSYDPCHLGVRQAIPTVPYLEFLTHRIHGHDKMVVFSYGVLH